jgi:hypothetical protein
VLCAAATGGGARPEALAAHGAALVEAMRAAGERVRRLAAAQACSSGA